MHNIPPPEEEVNFFEEQVTFPSFIDQGLISDWVLESVQKENAQVDTLNYIFCDDEYLLSVNKEYLNHDYYTDIITFPFQEGKIIEGDIYLSLDRIKENATTQKTTFENELIRVLAHGFLHLIGYKDKSEEDVKEMRKAEDECLQRYLLLTKK